MKNISLTKKFFSSVTDCQAKRLNGICEHQCNQVDCDYDREDCALAQNDALLGTIILQLEIDKEAFEKRKDVFLQRFSKWQSIH